MVAVGSWFVVGVMLNGCSLGGWFGDWNIWLRDCCLGSWSCGCSLAVCFLFSWFGGWSVVVWMVGV